MEVKKKIIIGSTFSEEVNTNYEYLLKNGVTIGIPHYYIKKTGKVINIIDTDKVSRFTQTELDHSSISIMLENSGYLTFNFLDGEFYDAYGDIYRNTDFIEKVWRNKMYWVNYKKKQITALKKLCSSLCLTHNIKPTVAENNIKCKDNLKKNILSRSNVSQMYLDLNPTFNFEELKQIENGL